ncbi:hypothetical protein [uncultured Methanocorpusculum sp.]|nr:hypothetical protein [uncultured Methanocorpusculum sp.]
MDNSEQNKVVKLELSVIFKTIGLLLVLVILLMLILAQVLPECYFGVTKTTMILYFGSSISGVAAFCAILISYAQTRDIQEENRKNIRSERIDSLKPFITLESIVVHSKETPSADIGISLKKNTDPTIYGPFSFNVMGVILSSWGEFPYKFNLKNIGNNSAHDCSLTMNGQKIFSGKAIAKGDSISLLTILTEEIQPIDIQFQLEFMDLGDNRYVQSHQYNGTLNFITPNHTIITHAPKPVSRENTCDDNLDKKS